MAKEFKSHKLAYYLLKIELAIVFQVLSQDKRFLKDSFVAKNGVKIVSEHGPSIDTSSDQIFLRGEETGVDFEVTTRDFESNSERDAFYDKMETALAEWSKDWDGWEEAETFDDDNVKLV